MPPPDFTLPVQLDQLAQDRTGEELDGREVQHEFSLTILSLLAQFTAQLFDRNRWGILTDWHFAANLVNA